MPYSRIISVVIPVFRDAERAINAVAAIHRVRLPKDTALQVLVVDDGSEDQTTERVIAACGVQASVIRLCTNQGRAAARNAGAAAASGEWILFIDCDCEPATDTLLINHLEAMQDGVVASCGPVVGTGEGFWHWYQLKASRRRRSMTRRGIVSAGSSQNLFVRREAFMRVGGFDSIYRSYGFEDRDLLIRLADQGRIVWADKAVVRHKDPLSLADVCSKMMQAGELTAPLFRDRHNSAYRSLGYAAIDACNRRWLVPLIWVWGTVHERVIHRIDRMIDARSLPYFLLGLLVRISSALSYMAGTRKSSLACCTDSVTRKAE